MKKYVFLYNIDETEYFDEILKNKIIKAIPETKILNETYMQNKIYKESKSIWIPEEKYLIAWTVANYEDLLGISFYELDEETTSDYGVEWYQRHKDNEFYVKYL